jgi:hypothetical protein
MLLLLLSWQLMHTCQLHSEWRLAVSCCAAVLTLLLASADRLCLVCAASSADESRTSG